MRNWGKGGVSQVSSVSTVCLEYARNILGVGKRKGHADLDVMLYIPVLPTLWRLRQGDQV